MKKLLPALAFLALSIQSFSQSCANYTAVRTTGITYSSINAFGTVVPSWRGQVANQNDDNRSNPVQIGFDFWYLGVRYSTCNIAINGFIDFSTTSYDGNWPLSDPSPQPPGYAICSGNISYREQGDAFYNVPCGSGIPPASYDGTYFALAAMYCDIWASNGTNALAYSIKYATQGVAPNRTFTVEYINMDDWASPLVSDYNFQIVLHETTGVIDFVYGSMFQVAGAVPYSCGINGQILTNPPTAAEMLVQQGDNSPVFSNTNPGLRVVEPTSNSQITFTPVCAANPGSVLTFTAVGNVTMTLNWTDWATNELGYVIYYSTDGINYYFMAQTAANATSYVANNLYGTTYWWKVYAVTEGCLSTPITGSQATLVGGTYYSIATGMWSNPATWSTTGCGGVAAVTIPTVGDNVVICNGNLVTIDGNYGCINLTVSNGGTLVIGNDATSRNFQVLGNIIVNSTGLFRNINTVNVTNTMSVSGNITNSGTFTMLPAGSRVCNVTFNRNGNQTVSGTGGITTFNNITINMGSSVSNTLDITSSNFSAPSDFLTMVNGTFKFSVPVNAVTLNMFSTITTIPSTCGLWMNSPNSTMTALSTLNFRGDLTCSAGALYVGNVANECLMSDGALLTISGGIVYVTGRLDRPSYVAITHVNISAGTLVLNTVGSTSTTSAPFMMDVIGSSFTMSGGTIMIKNEGGGGAQDLGYINTGCQQNYNVTGGTLQIGNASTAAGQNMQINTNIPIGNLLVSTTNSPTATLVTNPLTVLSNVTINSGGTLNSNTQNITLGGNWTNNGTFNQATNTVTFNSSSAITQTLGGTTPTTFYNLTINNTGTGGVTQNTAATVSNVYNALNGKFLLNALTLTLTNAAAAAMVRTNGYIVSENTGNLGKIQWNMGSTTGAHLFPFGTTTGTYIPFTFNLTAGTPNNVTVSSYGTPGTNLPWPTAPTNVANLNSTTGLLPDNRDATVDRFWQIDLSGVSGTADLTFSYDATELPIAPYNVAAGMRAQRYEISTNKWQAATGGQTTSGFSVTVPGVTTFSPWTLANNLSPLPIELISFDADPVNQSVKLDWTTVTEINNDYFTIEKTIDGIKFEQVTIVDGAGNSSQTLNYITYDETPFLGLSYYRLKQTDFNGQYSYSQLVPVNFNSSEALQINVYPNPSDGTNTNITVTSDSDNDILVVVYNSIGEETFSKIAVTGSNGETVIAIDNSGKLAPGVYMVTASTDNSMVSKKLIVR